MDNITQPGLSPCKHRSSPFREPTIETITIAVERLQLIFGINSVLEDKARHHSTGFLGKEGDHFVGSIFRLSEFWYNNFCL